MPGKQRSPLGVLVLSIFTLGVYWLVWTRRAFGELAEDRARSLPVLFWRLTVGLYVASLVVGGFQVSRELGRLGEELPREPGFGDLMVQSLDDQFSALGIVAMIVTVLLYLCQMRYLRDANDLVLQSVERLRITAPSTGLVVSFSFFVTLGAVFPLIGSMIGLAGYVIAVVWVTQVQGALNEFWRRIPYVPSALPAQGMPASILVPVR